MSAGTFIRVFSSENKENTFMKRTAGEYQIPDVAPGTPESKGYASLNKDKTIKVDPLHTRTNDRSSDNNARLRGGRKSQSRRPTRPSAPPTRRERMGPEGKRAARVRAYMDSLGARGRRRSVREVGEEEKQGARPKKTTIFRDPPRQAPVSEPLVVPEGYDITSKLKALKKGKGEEVHLEKSSSKQNPGRTKASLDKYTSLGAKMEPDKEREWARERVKQKYGLPRDAPPLTPKSKRRAAAGSTPDLEKKKTDKASSDGAKESETFQSNVDRFWDAEKRRKGKRVDVGERTKKKKSPTKNLKVPVNPEAARRLWAQMKQELDAKLGGSSGASGAATSPKVPPTAREPAGEYSNVNVGTKEDLRAKANHSNYSNYSNVNVGTKEDLGARPKAPASSSATSTTTAPPPAYTKSFGTKHASWSISSLKAELGRMGVSSAGCFEKSDLIEKILTHHKKRAQQAEDEKRDFRRRQAEKMKQAKKDEEEEKLKEKIVKEVARWAKGKSIKDMLNDVNEANSPSKGKHLRRNDSLTPVSKVYKRSLLKIHPDKHMGDFTDHVRATERFKFVNKAFKEFKDMHEKRRAGKGSRSGSATSRRPAYARPTSGSRRASGSYTQRSYFNARGKPHTNTGSKGSGSSSRPAHQRYRSMFSR